MDMILNSDSALKCLDNSIVGVNLYRQMGDYTLSAYKGTNKFNGLDFDVIITILRASLPMGLALYQATNKNIGFISAKRRKDLSIEINYKNIPDFKKPLIVDGWIASGNTVVEVAKELGIKEINLFGLIASKQALEVIKPKNYTVGYVAENMTKEYYIIPPAPFKPRDGGNDLFVNTP